VTAKGLTRIAWMAASMTITLLALGLVLFPGTSGLSTAEYVAGQFGNTLLILACSTVGLLIVSHRPSNLIGWIYAVVALTFAASQFAGSYALRSLPGAVWVALLPDLLWIAAIPLGGALLLLLFPTGRLPSPRWQPVVWAAAVGTAIIVAAMALTPAPLEYRPGAHNPLGLQAAGPMLDLATQAAAVVIFAAVCAAAAALLVRWRRARGVERQQLKWLAYAAVSMVALVAVGSFLPHPLYVIAATMAALLFPSATAIAILRYRLYEIDRLINRTLVYATLSALLAAIYAGVVFLLGGVLNPVRGESPLAVAASTLTVAALFQPLRRRIQAAVDQRFNRRRYDAAKTIEAFSVRLRDQLDLDALSAELLTVVEETMQPTTTSLWIRPPANRLSRRQP
jgi:hypothetical protein